MRRLYLLQFKLRAIVDGRARAHACMRGPLLPRPPQCVFERAVAAFPLTHSLWLQYGTYLETQGGTASGGGNARLAAAAVDVYGRAARNCPWMGCVWERAVRALDRAGAEPEQVEEMYGRALQAGLQVGAAAAAGMGAQGWVGAGAGAVAGAAAHAVPVGGTGGMNSWA